MNESIRDYYENFEEYEEEARKEREESVNWDLVHRLCTPKQIKAIELFVKFRLFEGAASIAEMSMLDFVQLLRRLGISRA